ncbi:MAG: phospho-sugar mutase [Clostridia bacterium]
MDAQKQAQIWATDAYFEQETRDEAKKAMANEKTLLSAFGTELHFGTGGLRGVLGVGTSRMNRYTVARATLGLAHYLKNENENPAIVVAYDSRHGSQEFTSVVAEVMASEGVKTYVFSTLAPTPMLSYAVRMLQVSAGVMITASHNPAEYNGYKVYGADGCQITDGAAKEITKCIHACGYRDAHPMQERMARKLDLWLPVSDDLRKSFSQACLFCRPDPSVCASICVVYTPLHGTGLLPVREVLGLMQGVTVHEVEAQCEPNGDFPTCPKPNPELDETLEMGLALAVRTHADLLLATDPDCDRVGVAVRVKDGGFRRLSGNEVGLLLADYILSTRKAQGDLPKQPILVKTIVTSDLAFAIAKAYGAKVMEVLTGFKYIGEVIGELERKGAEEQFVFGFEESCGYLAGTHVRDKDGVMACMLVCEMAQALKSRGLSVWDALENLYQSYGFMGTALLSFDIEGAFPMEEMAETMKRMRQSPPESLAGEPVAFSKDYAKGLNGLPKSDVLSFETQTGLKAIVRPSGTEPKVKVYLSAKGKTREQAQELVARMKADAAGWMGK